jgi:predicted TIM-barrel fold metal-dependent hydrolase
MKYPGRFIPLGILPTWDMDATVAEIHRLSKKGFHSISMNENPTVQGLPSIHNEYWAPFFKALADTDMVSALHIGSGNPAPHSSMESPIEAWISTMPLSVAQGVADWSQLKALHDYPNLRIAISEGSIGWVPYLMERADFANNRHKAWTHSLFQKLKPSEIMRRHFLHCFLHDPYGLRNLKDVGEDMVAFEVDYPHSDAVWPDAPEQLWEQAKNLTDAQIDKISHLNAIRFFHFDDMFKNFKREELTVGALRAKAQAKHVDVTPKSCGGARPSEDLRPVTSGDIFAMSKRHAEGRTAA